MRILHVISSIDSRSGGPSTALRGLAEAQAHAGLTVSVLATFTPGQQTDLADQLRNLGVNVSLIGPCHGPLVRHRALKPTVAQAVANSQIVHIHALWEEIQHQAARAARRQSIPYILRPCGMLDPWSLAQSRLKKRLYLALRLRRDLNRAALLHFTSQTERDLVAPLRLTAPTIIQPNGVRLDEFQNLPPKGQFRSRYPAIGSRPLIVFMGRLHSIKGLDLLIPAFARAIRATGNTGARLDGAVLLLAGPDSAGYGQTVQSLIREHNLADRVILPGMLQGPDRVAALADADLFVMPSYHENFGIAVIEALAAGCPVVISDQVQIHHEIAAAHVGAVVPTKIDALAAELKKWMTTPTLRAQAALRARPFVQQNYDWNQIAQQWRQVYEKLSSDESMPR